MKRLLVPVVLLVAALVVAALVGTDANAQSTSFQVVRTLPYATTTSDTYGRISVVSTGTGTSVLAAATRRSFSVQNAGAVTLYCARGSTVSTASYAIILEPNGALANDRGGQAWAVDGWGGVVRCIAASGTGVAAVDSF